MYRIKNKYIQTLMVLSLLGILAWRSWDTGMTRLEQWNGPAGSLTNDLFIPALMMNAGHGFVNVDPARETGLRDFLDFKKQSYDVSLLEEDVEIVPLHPFQEFHRYLIYTVAAAWRIGGVSWNSIKILIIVYLVVSVWVVFFISRLALENMLSFGIALGFLHAGSVQLILPVLRDFAKAPFILAVIFLLAYMVAVNPSRKKIYCMAASLGMVLGLGLGFRRDMMVFLPLCFFMLMICPMKQGRHKIGHRMAASALMCLLFILIGLPIHRALYQHGYVAAHDTIMGFASYSDHELGVIKPASYEKHYLLNDLFSTLRAHDAAKQGVTFSVEEYEVRSNELEFDNEMKSAYVYEIYKTFPADMISRAYGTVLRIGTGVIPSRFKVAAMVESLGVWFMMAGLLLLAFHNPIQAGLTLVLLLFCCGYTSLQFAYRHVFHMSFVPYFFAGITVYFVFKGLEQGAMMLKPPPALRAFPTWGKPMMRAVIFAGLVCVLLYTPLALARRYQHKTVLALRDMYNQAETIPIPYEQFNWNDRTVFVPLAGRYCGLCQTNGLIYDIRTRMLAALFKQVNKPLDMRLEYEWEGTSFDFSAPVSFHVAHATASQDLRYFFPVHESTTCLEWHQFVGISLPSTQAHYFAGFQQVKELSSLGLLFNMIVPETSDAFVSAQHIQIPWHGCTWTPYEKDIYASYARECEIRNAMRQMRFDEALEMAGKAFQERPGSLQFSFLYAETLVGIGREHEAVEVCLELLEQFPNSFVLYARMDYFFDQLGGAARREKEWGAILNAHPDLPCAVPYWEQAKEILRQEMTRAET